MSHAALTAALLQTNFFTGHVPPEVVPAPFVGELRSYLPPEARVTKLALMLYCAGITPWSWAREPDWLITHDDRAIDLAAQRAGDAALHIGQASFGLLDAVHDAESWLNERGQYLADPNTGERLFPANEETLH